LNYNVYTNKYKDNGREEQYLGIGFRAIMSQLMNDKKHWQPIRIHHLNWQQRP